MGDRRRATGLRLARPGPTTRVWGAAPAAASPPARRGCASWRAAALVAGGLALGGLALVVVVAAPPAAAEEVTQEQFEALLERAPAEPAALARLRGVDRVDGRPADMARALDGAEGADLERRLESLRVDTAGGRAERPTPAATADDTRAEARRILSGRRFHRSPVPRPLRGVLRWLGDVLRPVGEPFAKAWDRVSGNALAMGALAGAVVAVAAVVSTRAIRRRTAAGVARGRPAWPHGAALDPEELERQALAAERAGDLGTALRLRFRAGVVRLDRAGVVDDRPALTTGELTRRLPSPRLRHLAGAFEEVAYGGRPATAGDVDEARDEWPRVLEEASP